VGGSPEFGWKQWFVLTVGVAAMLAGLLLLAPVVRDAVRRRGVTPPGAWQRIPWPLAALAAVLVAVLAWTRVLGVDQSLWHDEAFSVLHFARGGPSTILSSQEYVPNDHVLFNLLSWATVELGGESPANRRLWAVVPSIAAVALVVAWAWRRLGPGTAVALLVLVVCSPMHLELAKEARGYGLTFLCGAAMLVSADLLAIGGGRRALGGLGLAGFAGIATLPVFALAFVPQAVPLVFRRDLRERVLLVVIVVAACSLGLYWSLLEDVLGNAGQEFGPLVTAQAVITGPLDVLIGPLAGLLLNEPYTATLAWRLALCAALLAGLAALAVRGHRQLVWLIVAPLLGTYALLALGHFHAETRFSSFLLFHALVPIAFVASTVLSVLGRKRPVRLVLAAGVAVVVAVWMGRVLDITRARVAEPREAFADAAQVVRGSGLTHVLSNTVRPEGLEYALGGQRFEIVPGTQIGPRLCREPPPFVFVDFGYTSLAPEVREAYKRCLTRHGGARVHLLQRERGGFIDVWIVPQSIP
jgi:hypothetical protein